MHDYIQWEYKVVGLNIDFDSSGVNRKVEDMLNDLGRQGWDVVAAVSMSDNHTIPTAVLMKRPHDADRANATPEPANVSSNRSAELPDRRG